MKDVCLRPSLLFFCYSCSLGAPVQIISNMTAWMRWTGRSKVSLFCVCIYNNPVFQVSHQPKALLCESQLKTEMKATVQAAVKVLCHFFQLRLCQTFYFCHHYLLETLKVSKGQSVSLLLFSLSEYKVRSCRERGCTLALCQPCTDWTMFAFHWLNNLFLFYLVKKSEPHKRSTAFNKNLRCHLRSNKRLNPRGGFFTATKNLGC